MGRDELYSKHCKLLLVYIAAAARTSLVQRRLQWHQIAPSELIRSLPCIGPTVYAPRHRRTFRSLTFQVLFMLNTMSEHQKEIEEFGNNDDFWLFGYGYFTYRN